MQHTLIKTSQAKQWLFLFIILHILAWTIVPTLVRYNLPMDSIEGAIWGQQLSWGYDKNPFLNGWLTALAVFLDQHSGWMIYLFSQISVALCLIAVWKLARKMLPETTALLSVVILEAIQYFNFHAIDFNDNTLELSCWAFAIYYFYEALTKKNYTSWLLTSVFMALSMMAKYYSGLLLISMLAFLFVDKNNRQQLKTLPPYIAFVVFLLIVSPHILWLFSHDFITVKYVFLRTGLPPSWFNHVFYPAQFAWQQFEAFAPAFIFFVILLIINKIKKPTTTLSSIHLPTHADKQFLLFVGLGPFLLTIFLSIILGIKLRAGWGMPLQSLWGVLLFAFFPITITLKSARNFVITMIVFMMLLLLSYSYSLIHSPTSSANFPGKVIAANMTNAWHEKFNRELKYVAGQRWLSGNISFYSKDHPTVFTEWNRAHAFWINVDDMKQKGALFVWLISEGEVLPDEVRSAFPELVFEKPKTYNWRRDDNKTKKILVGLAFLPPKDDFLEAAKK